MVMCRVFLQFVSVLVLAGVGAGQDLCQDIGNETDSGGDPCSYYTSYPQHCGCCDTTTFRASMCCACRESAEANWTAVFLTWPQKARVLRLPSKGIQTSLPSDMDERWPRLTEIDLSYNRLTGSLPPALAQLHLTNLRLEYNELTGSLPPALGQLSNLTYLYIDGNHLSGTLPRELGMLGSLKYFRLRGNQFTGGVPAEFGNMRNLRQILASRNALSGTLPAELFGLTNLQYLWLSSNQFTGSLPAGLGNLTELLSLDLSGNKFSDPFPAELSRLTNLRSLRLSDNHITFRGGLLSGLWKLTNLEDLDLSRIKYGGLFPWADFSKLRKLQVAFLDNCGFTGSISAELGSMTNLTELWLSNNGFNGSLPAELGNMTNLERIYLSANELSGALPAELGKLTKLWDLILDENHFTGSLPPELGNMVTIFRIRFTNNKFTGALPAELSKPARLRILYLGDNQLSGSFPAELGNMPSLTHLYLYNNAFSGTLPAVLGNITTLRELALSSNNFSGAVPAELGKLPNLQALYLHQNKLTGAVPAELTELPRLQTLALSDNQLSGNLPAELGNMTSLRYLYLQNNKLRGALPAELGKLTNLVWLELRGNQLSGSLPAELGKMGSLRLLHLQENNLSGTLPAELGELSSLTEADLRSNHFSGALPAGLGNLTALRSFFLQDNQLSGSLPPELGGLKSLQTLHLQRNQLRGGLPRGLRGLLHLQELDVSENPSFCGETEVLRELVSLTELRLRDCCFQGFGTLPASLQYLDLGGNRLEEVPRSWREQATAPVSLKVLLLDGNRIWQWDTSAVVTEGLYTGRAGFWRCSMAPETQPLPWQSMETLDISSNPLLDVNIYNFLATLSHLKQLKLLKARDAHLQGAMGRFHTAFVPFVQLQHYTECDEAMSEQVGFPGLLTLDLSGNDITAIFASPPAQLVRADLSRSNELAVLHSDWWVGGGQDALQQLDITGNPVLQQPVLLNTSSICPGPGATDFIANSQGWKARPDLGATVECTTLCPMRVTYLLADVALINETVLCRCTEGQGLGRKCSACPEDTYSTLSFGNGAYSRSCRACPVNSHLQADRQGLCFADCSCSAGYYMAQMINGSAQDVGATPCDRLPPEGECISCGIFRTSLQGSSKASDCFCNSNKSNGGWEGLLERQGQCGCPENFHVNFAERKCVPCQPQEDCADWTRNLEPPRVNRGFWAAPVPPRGSDGLFGNFSVHSIWRCQSVFACPGNFQCGGDLTGIACSLCRRGYFRNPSGSCTPCSQGPAETRGLLAVGLLACGVFPILAHLHLRADMREANGLALALRPVKISVKQILKFAQIMGLVSLFGVEWPDIAEPVFTGTRVLSLDFAGWLGVACLDGQQQESMPLVIGFRWVLPLAGVVVTCLAALLVTIGGYILGPLSARCCRQREETIRRWLRFKPLDVLRVLVFFLALFFPSLLKNALLPVTCTPSPNGRLTLNSFPQVSCFEAGEGWWTVASLGLVQTALLSLGFPLLLYFAWKRIDTSLTVEVQEQRQRWWRFVFADFRSHKIFWILVATSKDILLNLVVVTLPGLGTAQLLVTAVISIVYACAVFCTSPYPDMSNTLLETCTAVAVATLCLFTSGVGFQSDTDMPSLEESIAGGSDSSGYAHRTIALVWLQGVSLVCPAAIVCFQLLAAFPGSRLYLPQCLRPMTDEQRTEWSENFSKAMQLEGGPLPLTLEQLDKVDFSVFRQAAVNGKLQRKSLGVRTSLASTASLSQLVAENAHLKIHIAELEESHAKDVLELRNTIQQLREEQADELPQSTLVRPTRASL